MKEQHDCGIDDMEGQFHSDCWGPAVTRCFEDDNGELWVDNDEYCNTVAFCPFCGYTNKTVVEDEDSQSLAFEKDIMSE